MRQRQTSNRTRRKYKKATAPCRGPCADYRSRSRACNLKYCAFVCRAPPQLSVALNAFRSRQWKQTCHFRHGQGERHPHGYSTSFRASLVCCPEIFLNIIHHSQQPFSQRGEYGRCRVKRLCEISQIFWHYKQQKRLTFFPVAI